MSTTEATTGPDRAGGMAANEAVIRSFIDAWNGHEFDRFNTLMGWRSQC